MGQTSLDELLSCYPFSASFWIETQRHLAAADIVMKGLSKKYNMRFRSNGLFFDGGRWPDRSLTKRKFVKVYQIKISLNPKYLDDDRSFYVLSETCILHVLIWGKTLWHRKIAEYSDEDLNNPQLILESLENLIETVK